ncbi:MAG: hypothetical protein ACPGYT_14845 [Nitrospirales bacterium]
MTTPRIRINTISVLKRWSLAHHLLLALAVLALVLPTAETKANEPSGDTHHNLISGDRTIVGTVLEVRGGQYKVDTGAGQDRFIPIKVRKAKGLPDLKKGDRITISLNDQNLIIDVHLVGEASHHRIIEGQLAQPLITGHSKAVILTKEGQQEPHFIRPLAKSKVSSIPVGVDAIFLLDEINTIVDVTYVSKEAAIHASQLSDHKTPLKGNFRQVTGVLVASLTNNMISIRTDKSEKEQFEVRPLIQEKMQGLDQGQTVVLFVDEDSKVTDVSSRHLKGK